MTLAHELGHGVHQVLAGGQGQLMPVRLLLWQKQRAYLESN